MLERVRSSHPPFRLECGEDENEGLPRVDRIYIDACLCVMIYVTKLLYIP